MDRAMIQRKELEHENRFDSGILAIQATNPSPEMRSECYKCHSGYLQEQPMSGEMIPVHSARPAVDPPGRKDESAGDRTANQVQQ
jgi:hypothetical protein